MYRIRIGIDISGLKANLWFFVASHWGLDIRACATKDRDRALYCVGTPHMHALGPMSRTGGSVFHQPVLYGKAAWIIAKDYPNDDFLLVS